MNFHINEEFKTIKNNLLKVISDFDSFEASFGTGKRNSVKKIQVADKTVIIKSFKIPNFINQLIYNYFRKSKAQRSFEYATKLLDLGVKTATPIAYLEKFSYLRLRNSYYMSAYVECDLTYRELILQPDYPNHETILRAFTRFTYELHEKDVKFLDHSPGNTLIIINKDGYDFYLVDLNRMQFGSLEFEERMKNFSRLTPKKEMVRVMSEAYASISGGNYEHIFERMWFYTQQFQERFHRKKRLKKRFLGKK